MRNASGNFSKSLSASPEAFQRLSAQEGARGCGHAGVRDQLCGSFARTPLCGRGKRLRKGSASHGFTDSDSDFNGFGAVGLRPPAEGFRPLLRLGKSVHAMRNTSRNFPKSLSAPEAFQRLSAQERRGAAMWACGTSCVGRLRGRRFADAESGLKRIRFAHSTDYGVRLHECGAFGLKSPCREGFRSPLQPGKGVHAMRNASRDFPKSLSASPGVSAPFRAEMGCAGWRERVRRPGSFNASVQMSQLTKQCLSTRE